MKISQTSSIMGIVRPRSSSMWDFEIIFHLPQYKLSGPITLVQAKRHNYIKHLCWSDKNTQY